MPTVMGQITVLGHHEPYVTMLEPGEVRFTKVFKEGATEGESEERLPIKGGFLEVREGNEVRVLADE